MRSKISLTPLVQDGGLRYQHGVILGPLCGKIIKID